jgi:SAM-dependent methyltransferase
MFPDLAPTLAGRYDVVSMHHYLEHTRDPEAELDAAATVLEPGGLLLVEMPDPESRLARVLGQWWGAYLQPQHQHMMPIAVLERLLGERGFTTVVRQRHEPHQRGDFLGAGYLAINRLAPPVDVPWLPETTRRGRLRRNAVLTASAPVLGAAVVLDHALGPLATRIPLSNAYRVLARLDGPTAA